MHAVFSVETTFFIEARQYFVAAGEIVSGRKAPGMFFDLVDDRGGQSRNTVFSVDLIQRAGKPSQVALVLEYSTEAGLGLLQESRYPGKTIEIE